MQGFQSDEAPAFSNPVKLQRKKFISNKKSTVAIFFENYEYKCI